MSPEPDATAGQETARQGSVGSQPTEPAGDEPTRASGDTATEAQPTGEALTEPLSAAEVWDRLPPPVFEPGRVVFGKYRLAEKIGEGGMGEVWKVQNVELDRSSALKLIKAEIAQNDKGWTRFQREARLMAKLNHVNAVAVYDFRRTHSMGYIEMEFIRGRSLDQILKDNGGQPLPVDRVATILNQLCAVLHEAHGHRDEETGKPKPIIHRDLKPSNLMLVERGQADGDPVQLKVLDFGIAKMIEDDGDIHLTGPQDIVGTPAYMSPEQIRGGFEGKEEKQDIDARSDLYSTGVVLYHLLTGTLPFRGNKMTLLASHLNSPPMEFNEANPSAPIPREVERVVMRCLEKDPAKRPQSARELAESFQRASGFVDGTTTVSMVMPAPGRKALPWPVLAAAIVLPVGAGIIALFASMFRGPATTSSPAPEPKTVTTAVVTSPAPVAPAKEKTPDLAPAAPARPWTPLGFVAVGAAVDGPSGLLKQIKREDGAVFKHYRDGLYLPAGYRPQSADTPAGQWPSSIVRESDEARFVRIDGGVYLRGDPRQGQQPAMDAPGNPLTPHHVRVRGFYIQDREITNGDIQKYRDAHPEDEQALASWKQWYDGFRDAFQLDAARASQYPALAVNYRVARRYAAWIGGSLPTEAQWEYAAKSREDGRLFAWGDTFPTARDHPANLDNPDHTPAPVGTFEKDVSSQGVRDMTGNARELCADAYKSYDEIDLHTNSAEHPLTDHREPLALDSAGSDRIKVAVRGGSFADPPRKAFTFMRDRLGVDDALDYVGFRVVIECPSRDEDAAGARP